MAAPTSIIWALEPHTGAKHAILRRYLQAWTPILAQGGFPNLWYIDGFAGPGRYANGEDGSPIIALKAALEHQARIRSQLSFLFVEKDLGRAAALREIVESFSLPTNFSVTIMGGKTFQDAFDAFTAANPSQGRKLPPTFAFLDPFGWKGVPFSVVEWILRNPSCEVLVNFMYEEINRFDLSPKRSLI